MTISQDLIDWVRNLDPTLPPSPFDRGRLMFARRSATGDLADLIDALLRDTADDEDAGASDGTRRYAAGVARSRSRTGQYPIVEAMERAR